MITGTSRNLNVRTTVTNGRSTATADLPVEKGGLGQGFGAHELLESSLAACLSMTVQMVAAKRRIPLESATCTVRIERSVSGEALLVYGLQFEGELSEEQRQTLAAAAADCPDGRTLSGKLALRAEI